MSLWLGAGLLEDLGVNLRVWAVQVAIFLVTFVIVSRLLFARVLKHLVRREEEIKHSHEAIEKDRVEVERMAKEYEGHIVRIERAAYERAQEIYREALAACAQILAKAQAQSKEDVAQARAVIHKEKQAAIGLLREEVTRLTLGAVEKVLEQPLDPATHGAIVRKFVSERS